MNAMERPKVSKPIRKKLKSPIKALKSFARNFKNHIARCTEIDKANGRAKFLTKRVGAGGRNPMRRKGSPTKTTGKKKYSDLSDSEDEDQIGIEMDASLAHEGLTKRRSPNKSAHDDLDDLL
jgi:hypothetical protein